MYNIHISMIYMCVCVCLEGLYGRIMKVENDLYHTVEGDAVESAVDCSCRDEDNGVFGPSDVSLDLIGANLEVGIQMTEVCQSALDVFGLPVELAVFIVAQIFKKGDMSGTVAAMEPLSFLCVE